MAATDIRFIEHCELMVDERGTSEDVDTILFTIKH